ncbi:MAG: hypothetical protein QOD50_848, partial [Actinomycetota bacterium]|nr:hypothetical protein [Actinomycetota bacterium]
DVVAEGVETANDAEMLRAIGCTTGQGYLFSKPLAADAMTAWLEDHRSANQTARQPSSRATS